MNLIPPPLILQHSLQQYFLTTRGMGGVDGASIPHFWDRLHDFYPKKRVNFSFSFFWFFLAQTDMVQLFSILHTFL
jgi:hypothetical protein